MASKELKTPKEAYDKIEEYWPKIVEQSRKFLGGERYYSSLIYHILLEGGVPLDQLAVEVKMYSEKNGEAIPDIVIFKKSINGNWRRSNNEKTKGSLLLAIELKVSEVEIGRVTPKPIIEDVKKLVELKKEVGYNFIPCVMILDIAEGAPNAGSDNKTKRMTDDSKNDVEKYAKENGVEFFYASQNVKTP